MFFYKHVALPNSGGATNEFLASTGTCWIDVRDLANAHVLSLEKEAAGGERIIVSAGTASHPPSNDRAFTILPGLWKWQDFSRCTSFCRCLCCSPDLVVDAANAISPPPKLATGSLPKGNPGAGTGHPTTVHVLFYDTSKAARILGLKYRTIAETTKDTLDDYETKGW